MNGEEPLTWAEFIRLTRPRAPQIPRPRPAEPPPLPRRTRTPENPGRKTAMPAHPDLPAARCGRPATAPQREKADALFDHLSSLLREAADPAADTAALLRRADRAFDTLHRHLSRGGALPQPWRDARH